MSKHTPGPWQVVGSPHYLPEVWTADDQICIADRIYNGNANLIAAAPDLLAACKAALANDEESAGFCGRNMDDGLRKQLCDAITKAEAP